MSKSIQQEMDELSRRIEQLQGAAQIRLGGLIIDPRTCGKRTEPVQVQRPCGCRCRLAVLGSLLGALFGSFGDLRFF